MNMIKTLVISLAVVLGMTFSAVAADKVKVGFVYVGPIGDHGWTYRHDIGRQQVEEAYGDKVETVFVESVPEGPDAERVMRHMQLVISVQTTWQHMVYVYIKQDMYRVLLQA